MNFPLPANLSGSTPDPSLRARPVTPRDAQGSEARALRDLSMETARNGTSIWRTRAPLDGREVRVSSHGGGGRNGFDRCHNFGPLGSAGEDVAGGSVAVSGLKHGAYTTPNISRTVKGLGEGG